MIAAQYEVPLPADYDVAVMRKHVAARGAAFEQRDGLLFKAFLLRERGRFGAAQNVYAPFFVWRETAGFWGFAAGEEFRGIVGVHGRVKISTWLVMDARMAADIGSADCRAATCEDIALDADYDLALRRHEEIATSEAMLAGEPAMLGRVVAVNTERWSLMRFTLWSWPQREILQRPGVESFEVLRLAVPAA